MAVIPARLRGQNTNGTFLGLSRCLSSSRDETTRQAVMGEARSGRGRASAVGEDDGQSRNPFTYSVK